MLYLICAPIVLLYTLGAGLALWQVYKMRVMPRFATLWRKLLALLLLGLGFGLVMAAGMLGGQALSAALGIASSGWNDTGLMLTVVGLLVPAIVAGYAAMALFYPMFVAKSGDMIPVEQLVKEPAAYKHIERNFYILATAATALSLCVYAYGLG